MLTPPIFIKGAALDCWAELLPPLPNNNDSGRKIDDNRTSDLLDRRRMDRFAIINNMPIHLE